MIFNKRPEQLFAAGFTTEEIAEKLKLDEWKVLKLITEERSARLGLPSPYRSDPNKKPVIYTRRIVDQRPLSMRVQ